MNINFVGYALFFLAIKVTDVFWEVVFSRMWEELFAQIDWQWLTRKIKLNLLVLLLSLLLR